MQPSPYGDGRTAPGLRPLGVGEILDAAIKVFRTNFVALTKIVAFAVLPVQAVVILVDLSARPSAHSSSEVSVPGTAFGSFTTGREAGVGVAAVLIVLVLGLVQSSLATGACTRAVADSYLGGVPADARSSLRVALRALPALLWLSLLVFVGSMFGLLLCFVGVFWLTVSWIVATPALLVEGLHGTKAMRRSFRLVKPRWWPSFGLWIIANLLASAIVSVFSVVLVGVLFASGSTTSTAYIVTSGTITAIASLISTPFLATTFVILYFDLRVRNEGLDLQLVLDRLDSPVPPAPGLHSPPPPWAPGSWGQAPPPPPPPPPPRTPPAPPPPPLPPPPPGRPS